ncbi:MAG TPA: 2-dehydropantoate 2-reductase N-terminal domain-containing protein, partial [Pedococcus sp.]|nr:2-dehydropantoate 2-reductase N-terminal domain-containing protein [Pedococcus sp.]
MRHAVLGAGGVGGLLAAALARSGEDVVLLLRDETLRRYPDHLQVDSVVLGSFSAEVEATARLERPVDVLWVATKSTGLDESLAAAPAQAVGHALVVPLLNGLDHVARLRRDYDLVSAAAIRVETERTAPGRIRQLSPFLGVEISPDPDRPSARAVVERAAAALTAAGVPTTVRDDELGVLWDKFALLAPLALATTGLDATLGAVREDARFVGCQDEVFELAHREGASTDPEAVRRLVRAAPDDMRSSMQKD